MKLYISPSIQEANVGPNGYVEETQMNLIADILIPELIRHGQTVMRNDRTVTGVDPIVAQSNAWGADYHIAIHSNAYNKVVRGCEVYCDNPADLTRKGTQMAHTIYDAVTAIMPVAGRGVKSGHTTMSEVAHTTAPAALIEIDYHDTVGGADWIKANINSLAKAILLGILKQIGVNYIPKENEGFVLTDPTMKSDDIKIWQSAANLLFNAGLAVDGSYGPASETAEKKFETDNSLTVDGIVSFDDLLKMIELFSVKYNLLNTSYNLLISKQKDEISRINQSNAESVNLIKVNYESQLLSLGATKDESITVLQGKLDDVSRLYSKLLVDFDEERIMNDNDIKELTAQSDALRKKLADALLVHDEITLVDLDNATLGELLTVAWKKIWNKIMQIK